MRSRPGAGPARRTVHVTFPKIGSFEKIISKYLAISVLIFDPSIFGEVERTDPCCVDHLHSKFVVGCNITQAVS